ncbi:hypothetical protein, partial [Salmonella sp. s55004]|uniref:hypothetical protein n=1 Tax=Salmonella sp. s55004 TaxID=3159675 RepID=UPI00397EFE63
AHLGGKRKSEEHTATAKKTKILPISEKEKSINNFDGFILKSILSENAQNKSLWLLGTFEGSESQAIVLLEKTAFNSGRVKELMSKDTSLKKGLKNDIY